MIWNATVTETFTANLLVRQFVDVALSPVSGNFKMSDVVLWFRANSF